MQLDDANLKNWNDPLFIIKLKMLIKIIDNALKRNHFRAVKFKKLSTHSLVREFLKVRHPKLVTRHKKVAKVITKFGRVVNPKSPKKPRYKELN